MIAIMATLCRSDRIDVACVQEEMDRLRAAWSGPKSQAAGSERLEALLRRDRAGKLDRFDRVQREDVLAVCLASSSLAEAGRILFAHSRTRKKTANDSDRARKHLQGWDLTWEKIRGSI
jgi:transcriptional regulatory protein RtcR